MEELKTREELILSALPDDVILEIVELLIERVRKYGDVQASRVLFEFRYGKNPEPPQEGTTLEQLMLQQPLSVGALGSE